MKDYKARIVVVDDDKEMRALLEDYLTGDGYQVITFSSATDALQSFSPEGIHASNQVEGNIDLIISDIKMPQMTGLELTEQLKKLRPEIPIILITARSEERR